jgi:polysaccharide pyruvyl transferase WcaK-like protein
MKIIHFHFNTLNNKGDEAVVSSIRELFRICFNDTKIKFTSKKIQQITVYNRITSHITKKINKINNKKIRCNIKRFIINISKKIKCINRKKLLDEINNNDLVIIGGGGFYASWSLPLDNELIKKIEVPIVLIGVGVNENIGDKSLDKESINSIILLNKISKISSVRDEYSKKFLSKLNLNSINIGDPAIFLKKEKPKKELIIKQNKKIYVGINIANHGWFLQKKLIRKIINEYIKFMLSISKKYDIQWIYLKHHKKEGDIIKELKRKIDNIIICDCPPKELNYYYSKLDFSVSMMLHSLIFAFSNSIPMINVAYDKKNYSFMKDINNEENIIDVKEISYKTLSDNFEKLLKNKKEYVQKFSNKKKGYNLIRLKLIEELNRLIP